MWGHRVLGHGTIPFQANRTVEWTEDKSYAHPDRLVVEPDKRQGTMDLEHLMQGYRIEVTAFISDEGAQGNVLTRQRAEPRLLAPTI
jgi:hypothetical protein